ncbi:MAG: hypothetical protein IPM89_05540 [Candidatus Competibacteraceae bacterium]|nr:MAG: hypothetical protein IPM89_05540 [Candidatus Competibacteraceae bacterium]
MLAIAANRRSVENEKRIAWLDRNVGARRLAQLFGMSSNGKPHGKKGDE